MRTLVYCRTQFEGFHRWPDAPAEVEFLRTRHRHLFHVRLEVEVTHANRQVEFILLKRALNSAIASLTAQGKTETWSCEQWANTLCSMMDAVTCDVSEDNENGAIVMKGGTHVDTH